MKRIIYLLFLMTLIACKDSGEFDFAYPIFEVSDVDINSVTSITTKVKFIHVGSSEIIRYGFVWDWARDPLLGTFTNPSSGRGFIFIDRSPDFNGFSETIETSFASRQTHSIRAFVISATDTTYSSPRTFFPNP